MCIDVAVTGGRQDCEGPIKNTIIASVTLVAILPPQSIVEALYQILGKIRYYLAALLFYLEDCVQRRDKLLSDNSTCTDKLQHAVAHSTKEDD